ncbi:MAG: HmuY family protein [Myxococcales bacterium]|nr:HmuY family protein [Myxococcales bacterium]
MRRFPILLCVAACYPDLSDSLDPGPGTTGGIEPVLTEDGASAFVVNAASYDDWVAIDLDALGVTDEEGPDWDLAARRFEVKINGGVSGDGGVEVAPSELPFADVVNAPADGWVVDLEDANDDDVPEYALGTWYIYDYDTHELAPAEQTWVIRTTEGAYFKLRFDSYYDDAGTPAQIAVTAQSLMSR